MEFPYIAVTETAGQTEQVGRELAEYIAENRISDAFVALCGELGAGKTAFVRGLVSVLAPGVRVSSPTFTIVNVYSGPEYTVCHCDMYRIEGEDDLFSVGFYDFSDCVIAAEWCEKIPFALPDDYIRVEIGKTERGRKIRIERIYGNACSGN